MKYISLLLCGLLVSANSFSCASTSKKLTLIGCTTNPDEGYSKKEIMAICAHFIPIIGTKTIEDTFNAMTGTSQWNDIPGFQQYYLPIDELDTFKAVLTMTHPIPCIALGAAYLGVFASIVAGKAIYTVGKDITKGVYVITKDGVFCIKEVANGSYKILCDSSKKIYQRLFDKTSNQNATQIGSVDIS